MLAVHSMNISGELIMNRKIHSRINDNDCRMFRQRRSSSTAYKTVIDSAMYLLTITSPDIKKVAMSLYNIMNISDECIQ